MDKPIICLKDIKKSFFGVTVLNDVSFEAYPGKCMLWLVETVQEKVH